MVGNEATRGLERKRRERACDSTIRRASSSAVHILSASFRSEPEEVAVYLHVPALTLGTISGRGKYSPSFAGSEGEACPKGGVDRAALLKFSHGSEELDAGKASRIFSRARPPFL